MLIEQGSVPNREANQTFGKYNGLIASSSLSTEILRLNPIIDVDPLDPGDYIKALYGIMRGEIHQALIQTDIDFTNACSNNCPKCFARDLRRNFPDEIPFEKAVKILNDLKELGCKCVRMTGGGDPTDHPNFVDLVRLLGANFVTYIQTNGDKLCFPGYTEVVTRSAHRIRISVDSGNNQTRLLTHQPNDPNWDYDQLLTTMENLRNLAEGQPDRDSRLLIGASFVYEKTNYKSIGQFLKDMQNIGVDWVQIKPARNRGKRISIPGMEERVQEEVDKVLSENNKTILYLPDVVSFQPGMEKFQKCWVSQIRGFILAHSLLSICCLVRNQKSDFAKIGIIGDLEHPIRDLLFNEKGKEKVQHLQNIAPHGCDYCIDRESNTAFQNIVDILMNRSPNFQKANVQVGDTDLINPDNDGIAQIILNQKSFSEFERWNRIDL